MLRSTMAAIAAAGVLSSSALAGSAPKAAKTAASAPSAQLLIRQDFSDIHLFSAPLPADQVEGAEFSWSDDNVAGDTAWTANGMVGLVASWGGDTAKPGSLSVMGTSLAMFLKADHEEHSLPGLDHDAYAYGGSFEIGVDTYDFGTHYIRYTGSRHLDRIDDKDAYQSMVEWLYVNGKLHIGTPFPLLPTPSPEPGNYQWLARIDPELKIQHDVALDDHIIRFSGRSEALRVGPEVTLIIQPKGLASPGSSLFDLNRLRLKATYHWDIETLSKQDFDWLSAGLIYNFDEDGNFGVSATYKKGNKEDTGAATDIVKITLTGKY